MVVKRVLANTVETIHSYITVFEYSGQCLQILEVPPYLPDSNAVCLADSSGSLFVAGVSPLMVCLIKFDDTSKHYRVEPIIQREDLGLGCNFELRCAGISSNVHKMDADMATTVCVAIGDVMPGFIRSFCIYKIDPLLFTNSPMFEVDKISMKCLKKYRNDVYHFNRNLMEDIIFLEAQNNREIRSNLPGEKT